MPSNTLDVPRGGSEGASPSTASASGYHSEAASTASSRSAALVSAALPTRSGRKGSKKVRTGCITCKIRRVKCDEAKPACQRCTKTGRKCDGYLARNDSPPDDSQSPAPRRTPSPLGTPSSYVGWEPSEQRAFHFYRTCSSTRLFRVATSGFWGRVIPGLCFQEPAIRHAAIVISDLHERAYHGSEKSPGLLLGDKAGYPELSAFAAAHYGKAMRSLQAWKPPREGVLSGSASIAVPLLACALFICVEFMLGNETVAQMHINQGRQILASYRGEDSSTSGSAPSPGVELIRKDLVPIFTRLSLASFLFGSSPAPIPEALRWTRTQPGAGSEAAMAFGSAAEAEQALDEIMEGGLRFSRDATMWLYGSAQAPDGPEKDAQRAGMEALQTHFLALLERWHVAAAVLRSTMPGEVDGLSAKMSELYYLTSLIFVKRALDSRQTAYDQDTATFARLVTVAGEILDEYERGGGREEHKARFTFETGVIPPLYFTATRTRHPGLRRAAIAVLRRRAMANCNENLWNARRIVQIAQRTAVMEEERAMELGFAEAAEPELGLGMGMGLDLDMALDPELRQDWAGEAGVVPAQDFSSCIFGTTTQHDEWMAMLEEQAAPYRSPGYYPGHSPNKTPSPEESIASIVGRVPVSQPPSIPRDKAGMVFGSERAPGTSSSPESVLSSIRGGSPLPPPLDLPPWAADGGRGLQPPFNIPERARIKNAVISPQVGTGTWVTFFVAPEPGRGPHWGVVREFIAAG